jgi:flagellar M-ring protein FliF
METELTQLAEQVLGAGKAAIRVSTELDWDQTETTSEMYRGPGRGGKGIPVEEQTTTETYSRPDATPEVGGLAGAASNLDTTGTTDSATRTQNGAYNNSRISNKYAVNKVVERKVSAPGKVRRVSVAVLLDGKISLPKQRALKDAFAAAAGLDLTPEGRGDRIELLQMDFDRTADDSESRNMAAAAKQEFQMTLVRNIGAVLVVALMVGGTLLLLRKPKPAKEPKQLPQPARLDAMVGEDRLTPENALAEGMTADASGADADTEAAPLGLDGALQPGQPPVSLELIRRLADERPEEVARQLQVWMAE